MFKIILSNTKDTIAVEDVQELKKILERIAAGDSIIISSNGIFNPSYLVAILEDNGKGSDEAYLQRVGYRDEKDSTFAKLLSSEFKMLSDKDRTEVQEEVAKKEREMKRRT